MIYVSIIVAAFIVMVVVNTIYSTLYNVVNMPSARQTRNAIINDIRVEQGADNNLTIYDLGSGWSGLCRRLSFNFKNAKINGYEISPIPFVISKICNRKNHHNHRGNLFNINIMDADIIICYLSPFHMKQLETNIQERIKKGTILYSQGFPFPNIQSNKIIEIPYSLERKLYRYQF